MQGVERRVGMRGSTTHQPLLAPTPKPQTQTPQNRPLNLKSRAPNHPRKPLKHDDPQTLLTALKTVDQLPAHLFNTLGSKARADGGTGVGKQAQTQGSEGETALVLLLKCAPVVQVTGQMCVCVCVCVCVHV